MRPYLVSLAAGILVGIVYGLLNVRSPAPPVIALVGLLGILAGEQAVPLVKRLLGAEHALSNLPAGETDGPPGVAALALAIHAATGAVPLLFTEEPYRHNLAATTLATIATETSLVSGRPVTL